MNKVNFQVEVNLKPETKCMTSEGLMMIATHPQQGVNDSQS